MEENGSVDENIQDCVVPANFDELLTEQVRIHPTLYNPQDKHFKSPQKKEDTWNKIADSLDVTVELCCSRWRTLRERYVKKKKTISEYPEAADRIMDHWPLFSVIEDFLSPYISHRKKVLYTAPKSVATDDKLDSGSDAVDSPYGSSTHTNSVNSTYNEKTNRILKSFRHITPKKGRLKRLQQAGLQPANSNSGSNDVSVAALRALASIQKPTEEDEEGHFGHIVAATLRRLPPRQRAQTKLVIYQILVDSEFPPVVEAPQVNIGQEEASGVLPRNFSITETSDDIYAQVTKEEPGS